MNEAIRNLAMNLPLDEPITVVTDGLVRCGQVTQTPDPSKLLQMYEHLRGDVWIHSIAVESISSITVRLKPKGEPV